MTGPVECPKCRRSVRIRKDGRFYCHEAYGTDCTASGTFPPSDVAVAFARGRLFVEVDPPRKNRWMADFVGKDTFDSDADLRIVHVVSGPAGGEIRGYVLTEDGALRLRLPAYPHAWPELDTEVLRRVDEANRLEVAHG